MSFRRGPQPFVPVFLVFAILVAAACDAQRPGSVPPAVPHAAKHGEAGDEAGDGAGGGGFDPFGWLRRRYVGAPYPLDGVSRRIAAGTALPCGEYRAALVTRRGDAVRYSSPVRVLPAFGERLARFEAVVRDVGLE